MEHMHGTSPPSPVVMNMSSPPSPMAMSPSGDGDMVMDASTPTSAMSTMMMQMTFYWGSDVTLLFDAWKINQVSIYCIALVLILLFAMLHEALTSFRIRLLFGRAAGLKAASTAPLVTPSDPASAASGGVPSTRLSLKLLDKAVISVLYTLSAGMSYFLMLMVMTYNGGIFIAVVVGFGLGYFFFGFDRAAVANQSMSDTCCV